jgi:hypothetical protein
MFIDSPPKSTVVTDVENLWGAGILASIEEEEEGVIANTLETEQAA